MKCNMDGCKGQLIFLYEADSSDLPREKDTYNYMIDNEIPFSTPEAFIFSQQEYSATVEMRYKVYCCNECSNLVLVNI